MKLNRNPKHKRIDISALNLNNRQRLVIAVGGTLLSIITLSGCETKESEIIIPEPTTSVHETDNSKDFSTEALLTTNGIDIIEEGYFEESTPSILEEVPEHDDSETIELNSYAYGIEFDDGSYNSSATFTYGQLKHIKSIIITLKDDGNYDFLNYMPNLEKLYIYDFSKELKLENIDGSKFKKNIEIEIKSPDVNITFSESRYPFLKDISYIKRLVIGNNTAPINIDSNYLQTLKNVHNLYIALDINSNFHYKDLTYLDSLILDGKIYDIAMYFSNNTLEELEKAGVKVETPDNDRLKSINARIENIVKELNINPNTSDQEKLNIVLTYILENFKYDEYIATAITNNEEHDSESFYREGHLTAAFENNTQICGNYAAMTYVLANAAGLNTYNMLSANHAWNAVKVGEYYYYVDSTWLDERSISVKLPPKTIEENGNIYTFYEYESRSAEEIFKEGNQELIDEFRWYMEDPTKISDIENEKESHAPLFIPEGLIIEAIPEEEVVVEETAETIPIETSSTVEETTEINKNEPVDISNKKFKITFNNKTYIIGGAALIGILSGLGIAFRVSRKKAKERKKRKTSYTQDSFNYYSNNSYYDWNNTSSNKRRF